MKLKNRMLLLIGIPTLLLIIILVFVSYHYSKNLLIEESRNSMIFEVQKYGSDLESIVSEKRAYIEISAGNLSKKKTEDEEVLSDLKYLTQNVKGTLGFFLGCEDGKFLDGTGWIPDSDFDPRKRDWYIQAKGVDDTIVSPPYENAMNKAMVVTISKRVEHYGAVSGVLGSDVSLEELQTLVSEIQIKESGKAFLMDSKGNFMIHDEFGFDQSLSTVHDGKLADLAKMIFGGSEFVEYELNGIKRFYAAYELKGMDWILVLEVPVKEVLSATNALAYFMLVIGGVCVFLIAVIIFLIANSIVKPIIRLSDCIQGMVEYDFTLTEQSPSVIYSKNKDEIGVISRSLIKVKTTLKEIIVQINDIASQLSAASEELTASSEQSADTSNDLAKIVNEISNGAIVLSKEMETETNAMETMGQALLKNESIMKNLNDSAAAVQDANDNGMRKISQLIDSTQRTKKAAVMINDAISNTNEKAMQISSASDMIKSISDQTNLLALNAAIEAARAGESGRGFAVVAEEIRKLAEQSNTFTEEINQIVEDLVARTSQAVKIMNTISDVVAEQSDRVNDTKEQFHLITGELEKNQAEMQKLNEASNELEQTKDALWNVINSLSSLSEENATHASDALSSVERQNVAAQEVAMSSVSLAQMAQEMIDMMSKFKV